jgi:hypothetical protein
MGGFIVLEDGRALAPSNWAYDAMVRSIAAALGDGPGERQLAEWLLKQQVEVSGLGHVDVRALTAENRRLFRHAVERAVQQEEARGPVGWDEAFFPSWLAHFKLLLLMWEHIDSGQPPESLNDLKVRWPPPSEPCGPGW